MKTKILKIIEAGPMVEKIIYTPPTRYDTQQQRAQRSKVTSKAQAEANRQSRVKRLERYIWANFELTDRFVTFTYSADNEPSRRKTARADFAKAMRQIRESYRKAGYKIKYIYSTEDKHGDGRIHHHAIINSIPGDVEILRSLWTYGGVEFRTINENGQTPHDRAVYMAKEAKPNSEQGFVCSRNIEPPTIKTEWIDEDFILTAPRGAVVLEEGKDVTEWAEYYHLKYIRPIDRRGQRARAAAAGGRVSSTTPETGRPGRRQPVNCTRRI